MNAVHGGHLWNQQSETVVCEEIIRILGVRETRTRMIYFIHKKNHNSTHQEAEKYKRTKSLLFKASVVDIAAFGDASRVGPSS